MASSEWAGWPIRDKSPSVKRGYNDVAKDTDNVDGGGFRYPGRNRQPRKMNYGTNTVEIDGGENAPIDIFVGNTGTNRKFFLIMLNQEMKRVEQS